VAGANDHIVPWENAYRSTQLLGGESRFVLSTSGHIQALVNPPGGERRTSYRVADENPPEAAQWLADAAERPGSWWPDYLAWLQQRSGALVAAPKTLGSRAHKATAKAPGTYVAS
jgi:poly(3-hydroxyalkanoate) synthetase